jgi:hypothetical protein
MLYFITFINDHKRHMSVAFMEIKSQVLEKFKRFKGVVETFTWHKLEILWIDNGVEYIYINFYKYYYNRGIIHQISKSYSLGSNNTIEKETNHYARLQLFFSLKQSLKDVVVRNNQSNMAFVQHASNQVVEELDIWTNIYWNLDTRCFSLAQFWY